MSLATAYLDNLNSEQRDAVEHGIGAAVVRLMFGCDLYI